APRVRHQEAAEPVAVTRLVTVCSQMAGPLTLSIGGSADGAAPSNAPTNGLDMKKIVIIACGAGALAAAAVSLAPAAIAAPVGSRADDAVNNLQSQGYSVRINGAQTAPLSACTVTDVSGLS